MKASGYFVLALSLFLIGCRSRDDHVKVNDDWKPQTEFIEGSEMALVPPGCFMMGSDSSQPDQRPRHEVCFEDPYWIDVYEVTNEQFGSIGYEQSSSLPKQPRNCVSWMDASAHCADCGARLPTEAEWEYAARGPDGLLFTWGNKWDAKNVVYGGNALNQPAEFGGLPGGISWVGVFNLGGNLREWVNDWYYERYYSNASRINPQGPDSGEYRVVRTNSFGSHYHGFSETTYRTKGYPKLGASNRGFRCASDYSG
ncbi:MAG: SUMF1/EgtB/PvdO family nonheme iron enzyme [Candidatus Promineifilaceae bacterium]